MSNQITTAFENNYRSNIELLLQQRDARVAPFCRQETQQVEFDFYDRIGATDMEEVTTRHGDTPLIETPHDRRAVTLRFFDWADLIDRKDKVQMLKDPTSSYVLNAVAAANRTKDRVVIESAFAAAQTGKTGTTSVTFPASQVVAVNYVESGSAVNSGMTIGKLRNAKKKFMANEVDKDEPLYIAQTAEQFEDLLQTTEVTSADYNTVRALVDGKVDTFMGFKFLHTELVEADTNSYRRVIAFSQTGLLHAMGAGEFGMMVRVTERSDKRFSVQPYVALYNGATRMEEGKVVEIKCAE